MFYCLFSNMGDKTDTQYLLESSENGALQMFPTQYPVVQGTFSPSGTFNEIYPTLFSQNSIERSQSKPNESFFPFSDLPNWDIIKLPEKVDLLEIGCKDLSPSSYCSNIDNILQSENYLSNRHDTQWCGNLNYGSKSAEYLPCAQMAKNSTYTQKGSTENDTYKSCAYYSSEHSYNQNNHLQVSQSVCNYPTYYNTKFSNYPTDGSCYDQNYIQNTTKATEPFNETQVFNFNYLNPADQQTEISNDESDIIVEDSSSDCSEEQEKKSLHDTTRCVVCNMTYMPMGLQFYGLNFESPLTMSSQKPVIFKISEITGSKLISLKNYLCNDCLGLINTIDHLQLKLENFIKELSEKFKRTCREKNVRYIAQEKFKKKRGFSKYRCKKCNKIVHLKTIFERHLKTHKTKGYLCELCGKTSPTFKKLKMHLNSHKNKNIVMITSFKCTNNTCDKIFRTNSNLKEHENYCLGTLPFKCKNQYCDKKFASLTKLKNHMKLKHDKKFIAICSICNIGFVKVSDYKSHMISHSTDKKFSCSKCNKAYKSLGNLNFHLKSHEETLPYTCSICKKGFMRKEYYEAHVNNHKGIKSFSCPVCEKKFVSQKNLDGHLKYHEGSVKKDTCNICGKVITSGFEEHLRIHANLKEFECDLCDMKFNTKNTLAKHKKRKHLDIDKL